MKSVPNFLFPIKKNQTEQKPKKLYEQEKLDKQEQVQLRYDQFRQEQARLSQERL